MTESGSIIFFFSNCGSIMHNIVSHIGHPQLSNSLRFWITNLKPSSLIQSLLGRMKRIKNCW